MSKLKGRLLGYDAREGKDDNTAFSPDQREIYLLRPEIESPLSVDRHIWPSRFSYHSDELLKRMGAPLRPDLIKADPDCQDGMMWLSLTRMKERLGAARNRSILLAVELLIPKETEFEEYPSPLIFTDPEPSAMPVGSVRLGYDVADAAWSGLSNCGYSPAELTELRPVWGERINEHGLLKTEEDAIEFCAMTDKRVPEHAPFWIYALYRVEAS